jgi:putative MFS transporter
MIALLGLGFFFELYDLLLTGSIAPGLVKSGILTATTPGLFGTTGIAGFIAALFAGLFLGTLGCGFLADRFGRRAIFTWSLIAYSAANLAMAFQTGAFGLEFWRFLAGLGLGVEMVTIGTYLSELAPKALRGRAFAICQAMGFSAVPVVSFLAYGLVGQSPLGLEGWRWVVLIGVVAALVVWWIRSTLPESPRWLAQIGRLDEAERVLAGIEDRVERDLGRPLPPPGPLEPAPTQSRFADMWQPPFGRRAIMLVLFNILQSVGFYGFINWVPTLLISRGITVTSSLEYAAIIALAAPVGPLIGYWIADKFERKSVIVVTAGANVISGLLFAEAEGAWAIIALGIALTLENNIMSYSFHTYQQELFPTGIRARASGFVYSWSRFSAIFNAFLIAFCLGRFGVLGVFVFIAAAMIGVMAVIGLMGPKTRNISLEGLSR